MYVLFHIGGGSWFVSQLLLAGCCERVRKRPPTAAAACCSCTTGRVTPDVIYSLHTGTRPECLHWRSGGLERPAFKREEWVGGMGGGMFACL